MDWPAIIAKVVGAALLAWTLRSLYKHVRTRVQARKEGNNDGQSTAEAVLNGILLYAWLLFMMVFSTGMIVNN